MPPRSSYCAMSNQVADFRTFVGSLQRQVTPSRSLPHQGGGLREAAEIVRTRFASARREAGSDIAHAGQRGVEVEIADLAQQCLGLWRA